MQRFLDPRERVRSKLLQRHATLQAEHTRAVGSGRLSRARDEMVDVEHMLAQKRCRHCDKLVVPIEAMDAKVDLTEVPLPHFSPTEVIENPMQCPDCGERAGLVDPIAAVVACFRCGTEIDIATSAHSRMTVCCIVDEEPSKPRETAVLYEYFAPPTAAKLAYGGAGLVALLAPPETGELALCTGCRSYAAQYLAAQEVEAEDDLKQV